MGLSDASRRGVCAHTLLPYAIEIVVTDVVPTDSYRTYLKVGVDNEEVAPASYSTLVHVSSA